MRYIRIAWCSRIKNDAIQDSIKHLSNLTELDISWKTPTDSIIDVRIYYNSIVYG
jgi:hypothetical protein